MSTLLLWERAGQTYSIRIDATVQETHTYANTVTDHPVERGAALTDHVRPDPVRLSLAGIVSNQPHLLPADLVEGVIEVGLDGASEMSDEVRVVIPPRVRVIPTASPTTSPLRAPQVAIMTRIEGGTTLSAKVRAFTQLFDRVRGVFSALVSLREEGTLIRVETGLSTYTDMVIESLTVPVDASAGDALIFDLTLKQVRTAEIQIVEVKRSKGRVSPKVVTRQETEQGTDTVLGVLADKLGWAGGR